MSNGLEIDAGSVGKRFLVDFHSKGVAGWFVATVEEVEISTARDGTPCLDAVGFDNGVTLTDIAAVSLVEKI